MLESYGNEGQAQGPLIHSTPPLVPTDRERVFSVIPLFGCKHHEKRLLSYSRTFSMNISIFSTSFTRFVSTPLLTSTPQGYTWRIAALTFSGVRPPASRIGISCATVRASVQSWVWPVPPHWDVGVSSKIRQHVSW